MLLLVASGRRSISPSSSALLACHHAGATPLMFGLMTGNFEIAAFLLSARASRDLANRGTNTLAGGIASFEAFQEQGS